MRLGKKGNGSSDLILDLYSSLLSEIWEIVSELIGESILQLLFTLAIRKAGEKYLFLKFLKMTEEGIFVDKVRENCQTVPPAEIHRGFQSLLTYLFDLFSALAEGVVSREVFPKVFPKVREAERIISQK
jgi:hypothetical protein